MSPKCHSSVTASTRNDPVRGLKNISKTMLGINMLIENINFCLPYVWKTYFLFWLLPFNIVHAFFMMTNLNLGHQNY